MLLIMLLMVMRRILLVLRTTVKTDFALEFWVLYNFAEIFLKL